MASPTAPNRNVLIDRVLYEELLDADRETMKALEQSLIVQEEAAAVLREIPSAGEIGREIRTQKRHFCRLTILNTILLTLALVILGFQIAKLAPKLIRV